MREVTLVILNSLRIKCHIRRPLTNPVGKCTCERGLVLKRFKGGGWSRKGLNFEWPYFCQYLSELYQIFSSCVLCGYIIN